MLPTKLKSPTREEEFVYVNSSPFMRVFSDLLSSPAPSKRHKDQRLEIPIRLKNPGPLGLLV